MDGRDGKTVGHFFERDFGRGFHVLSSELGLAENERQGHSELDVVVADDLYAVAPRIEEIEELTGQRFHASLRQGLAHGLFVIDNESKMTAVVGGLGAALLESQELITQVDEGRGFAPTAK